MQGETVQLKANAHLAHLQAQTHKLTHLLAKEPNFCRRTMREESYINDKNLIFQYVEN